MCNDVIRDMAIDHTKRNPPAVLTFSDMTERTVQSMVAYGNKKLPATTCILNSSSAASCPSRALGLCQCPDKCYARKAELQYPGCEPYRDKQSELYLLLSPKQMADALIVAWDRKRTAWVDAFRFNEAGDFLNQAQLDWTVEVIRLLKATAPGSLFAYGYTARTDLDLRGLLKVATVNVSNDLNGWQTMGANRFLAVEAYTGSAFKCAGDCRICKLCRTVTGTTIEVALH